MTTTTGSTSAVLGLPPLHSPDFDGGAGAVGSIKTPAEWVTRELHYYKDHFTNIEPTKVSLITFNVAEKKPGDISFMIQTQDGSLDDADVICVGFQEVDMSASALMKEETEAAVPWINALRDVIGADTLKQGTGPGCSTKAYYPLASKQMVGLLTCLFIKKSLLPHVTDPTIGQIATGALGAVGNKGGVGVRFGLRMSSICIINVHLAAHQEKVEKRNQDIDQILRDLTFPIPVGSSTMHPNGAVLYPREHDMVLVMGDLNYRVDLTYEEALACTRSAVTAGTQAGGSGSGAENNKGIQTLLKNDQLVKEMKDAYSPWQGFTDCQPTWLPTYRFDKGSSTYDTSEKKRIPSYTDRILYMNRGRRMKQFTSSDGAENLEEGSGREGSPLSGAKDEIHVAEAHAVWKCLLSDHKPIRSGLVMPIRTFVKQLRVAMHQKLTSSVSDLGLDKVSVARTAMPVTTLDFGEASYGSHSELALPIENKGDCVAVVRVLRKGERDPSEASWLRVSPTTRLELFPGEKTSLRVMCKMDKTALNWLASVNPEEDHPLKQPDGKFRLTSFLLVAVASGPMHLVECKVVVQPSCFASSLDTLTRFERSPCRVAYIPKNEAGLAGSFQNPQGTTTTPSFSQLPKELWYMCDYLFNYGNDTVRLFVEAGKPEEIARVRAHLDSEVGPFPPDFVSPYAVAHALVLFLRDLQGSVVPQSQYFNALAAGRQGGKAPHMVVSQLPPLHCNVLVYVCSFLRYLLKQSSRNQLSEEVVSQVFAAVMLQPPPDADIQAAAGVLSPDRGGLSGEGAGAGPGAATAGGNAAGGQHADPANANMRGGLEVRAELSQRKQDAIGFIRSFFVDQTAPQG